MGTIVLFFVDIIIGFTILYLIYKLFKLVGDIIIWVIHVIMYIPSKLLQVRIPKGITDNVLQLNSREVGDILIDGIDSRDYPKFSDAYVSSALYIDTGEGLTSSELKQLQNENKGAISTLAFENLIP